MSAEAHTNAPHSAGHSAPTSGVSSEGVKTPAALVRPRVDMFETDGSYLLRVEMPGVDESQIDIQVEREILTLSAEVDLPAPQGFRTIYGNAVRRRYERSFKLADDVDAGKIDAEVKNGLLTLTLPKVQPSVLRVAVKRGS